MVDLLSPFCMDSPVDMTDDAHEQPQMLHENESTEAGRCFLLSFFARITAALLTSKFFVP